MCQKTAGIWTDDAAVRRLFDYNIQKTCIFLAASPLTVIAEYGIINMAKFLSRTPRFAVRIWEEKAMKEFTYTIKEPVGIHARPAGLLVKEVKGYQSTVTILKGDKSVNAVKLMALMGMGIKCGDTVTVQVEGPDEDAAAPALEKFFNEHL